MSENVNQVADAEPSAPAKSKTKMKAKMKPRSASAAGPKAGAVAGPGARGVKGRAPAKGPHEAILTGGDEYRRAAERLKICMDPVRIAILSMLAEKQMNVTEMVTAINKMVHLTQPAASHHLKRMKVAGLVESRRSGKHNYYTLAGDGPKAVAIIRHFMAS